MQNSIGQRIALLRAKHGWTQAELTKRAGLSAGAISQIESGETKRPLAETLRKIAAAFGVPLEYLMGLTTDETTMPDLSPGETVELPREIMETIFIREAQPYHLAAARAYKKGVNIDIFRAISGVLAEETKEDL